MEILWGSTREPELNAALGEWCRIRIGLPRPFASFTSLGVFQGGELLGAAVFHNYEPESGVIEVSGASSSARWLPRQVLYELFSYVFDQLGCQMAVFRVSEKNTRLHRIMRAYGFDEFRIPRLAGRHEDQILFTLTDDAWRANGFHREHRKGIDDGQISTQAA